MDRSATRRFAQQRRSALSPFAARQAGFTLVEMAVVLVIIGVILSAVMIGRDAQRNAEYLRIRQTFVNQWALAYNSYAQRTGVPVGDNIAAPRLMVNGTVIPVPPGGDLTGFAGPGALCEGAAAPGIPAVTAFNLRALILQLGIELPNGRGLNSEDRYVYLDTNGKGSADRHVSFSCQQRLPHLFVRSLLENSVPEDHCRANCLSGQVG